MHAAAIETLTPDHSPSTRSRSTSGSRSAIAATLNECRWDEHDTVLQSMSDGVIAWTPVGKDDDVFLLQSAADHGAWVVTNDRWNDHARASSRHATHEV
ncbi:MAG: hypothetical protein VX152_12470, partial [Pseudomonadota bacterium]|nr:hypothetical protein [Pseudomonadota bacterium]